MLCCCRWPTFILVLSYLAATGFAADIDLPSEERLWSQADARIDAHRRRDVTFRVVDRHGDPVPDAEILVQQTRHAFLFGCNIFNWNGIEDQAQQTQYRDRFAELLNFATIGFYWASYESEQGQPRHAQAEAVARWCVEKGIQCKGHPLAWNYSDPRWLPDDSEAIFRLQQARITDCIERHRGLIATWDIVNEPTHVNRQEFLDRAPKMTRMWMDKGQIEFTKACFESARVASANATLLVNDYRTDEDYAAVIDQLLDGQGDRLYDVIGIQSHQHSGTWSNQKIWEVCERFKRFNVPLHFTETTILSGDLGWRSDDQNEPWPSTQAGEAYQARELERFYTMLYSHPAVEAITWWDFSDQGAWKRAPAGLLRRDMTPKPAYEALRRLVLEKWWTDEELTTDALGSAVCRATYGDYKLSVSSPSHPPHAVSAAVTRSNASTITLRFP